MNANTTDKIIFTANTIAIKDQVFPVEYSIHPNGTVFAFVNMADGEKTTRVRIKIDAQNENYATALEAAKHERASREEVQRQAAAVSKPEPAAKPMQSIDSAQEILDVFTFPEAIAPAAAITEQLEAEEAEKQAQAVKPKKTQSETPKKEFVGMEIKGNGWKISFDGSYDRTRVIFKRKPSDRVREAVKAAGFYWSPVMKSWNKKLTNKAFMAAQNLAIELRKLCA